MIKTSELSGAALDLAVGIALGWVTYPDDSIERGDTFHCEPEKAPFGKILKVKDFLPSTDWGQGGPIIEYEGIKTLKCNDLYFPKGNENGDYWEPCYKASYKQKTEYGTSTLIAAMRCFVAGNLGDVIELPGV